MGLGAVFHRCLSISISVGGRAVSESSNHWPMPGDRVLVFDHLLWIDDKKTPLSVTLKPATVLCRYGFRSEYRPEWIYPDCVEVQFDHRERPSRGHFTDGVHPLPFTSGAAPP